MPNPPVEKTVIILGAGASKASVFNLPTMKGFFSAGFIETPEIEPFLKWFYPGKSPQDYNLEEVLAYLDLSEARKTWRSDAPREPPYAQKPITFENLLQYVKKRLAIPLDGDTICPLHVSLFEKLNDQDSIITLNYDLIADSTLWVFERERYKNNRKVDPRSRTGKLPDLIGTPMVAGNPPITLTSEESAWGFYLKLQQFPASHKAQ